MRRLRRFALVIVLLVIAVVVIGFGVIESAWFKERVRRYAVTEATRYVDGTLLIGKISGNWWSGVELSDVKVVQGGQPVLAIQSVRVGYQFRELYTEGATRIRFLKLSGLAVVVDHRPDGSWNLAHLLKERKTAGGAARPVHVDRIEIDNSTAIIRGNRALSAFQLPERIPDINAVLAFESHSGRRVIRVDAFQGRGVTPAFAIHRYSGSVEMTEGRVALRGIELGTDRTALHVDGAVATRPTPARFELTVNASRFDFQEIAQILPGIRTIGVTAAFTAKLSGPRNAMRIDMNVMSTGGDVAGTVRMDFVRPG
jgi:translocation and assembly module TamB